MTQKTDGSCCPREHINIRNECRFLHEKCLHQFPSLKIIIDYDYERLFAYVFLFLLRGDEEASARRMGRKF
jgi:hypothetical protein